MRFLADEICDFIVVRALRAAGHDVSAVSEVSPGADDTTVIDLALEEKRILLTEDKDFGQLVYANPTNEWCPLSEVSNLSPPENFKRGREAHQPPERKTDRMFRCDSTRPHSNQSNAIEKREDSLVLNELLLDRRHRWFSSRMVRRPGEPRARPRHRNPPSHFPLV